ncbi:MAG TPA: AAA family ATPase [Solirubrobacteraceae bacterium]|nr:AAA family ATPase [Solirubrobacteraceae bacterium]
MSSELPDVGAFAAGFSEFIERMNAAARGRNSALVARLRDHLGVDPKELPSTSAEFAPTDHPNLQLALDAVLPDAELVGFSGMHPGLMMLGLSGLLSGHAMAGSIEIGPVQYTDIEVGGGRVVRCVSTGAFLASREGSPLALVLSASERPFGSSQLRLEGVAPEEGLVSAVLADLRAAMRERNVYRGQVISLHGGEQGKVSVQFHAPPPITREAVVLPTGIIERLERHTIGVASYADRLKAADRQLKRGVLLHGPPGTGKTLTVNYLLSEMAGRTTVLLTGRALGLVEPAVAIARELTPATVVLEDVDLVATERTMPSAHAGILFELLNQMEGLADDADLLFLLTTNRADLIEPALAARPGRVDLALEIPLPDEAARGELMSLYAQDIPLDGPTIEHLVARTDGLTGAFIKELMRQAALRAALEERPPRSADATAALEELLEERSTLTRRLLGQGADGASTAQPGPAPFPAMLHAFGAAGIPVPELGDQ